VIPKFSLLKIRQQIDPRDFLRSRREIVLSKVSLQSPIVCDNRIMVSEIPILKDLLVESRDRSWVQRDYPTINEDEEDVRGERGIIRKFEDWLREQLIKIPKTTRDLYEDYEIHLSGQDVTFEIYYDVVAEALQFDIKVDKLWIQKNAPHLITDYNKFVITEFLSDDTPIGNTQLCLFLRSKILNEVPLFVKNFRINWEPN
jgi:hypothetical protein